MTGINENPDGTVGIELSDNDLAEVDRLVNERRAVPVFEFVETDRWTTRDGYEIVEYEHRRVYPTHLRFSGVNPGQTEEQRGWPCPTCGSTDTSVRGITTVPERSVFVCGGCGATGDWLFACRRRPSPVHLHGGCVCPPECGCEYSPSRGIWMAMDPYAPSADVTATVAHQPGCEAAH